MAAIRRSRPEVLLELAFRILTCGFDSYWTKGLWIFRANFIVFTRNIGYSSMKVRRPDSICCRVLSVLAVGILLDPANRMARSTPTRLQNRSTQSEAQRRALQIRFHRIRRSRLALDTSQRAAALNAIRQAQRPLLFVYIHGWMNNAVSGDVCRFEHFIDMVSRLPEVTQGKINVIGVYIAWRGKDLSVPGLDLLTFWNRKLTGGSVAAQNSCLATINELALAAREPGKQVHHCVLMGHSFGGLVLSNTISHSILDASSTGARNASPWDMAVAFNPADDSIGTRQLMSELDYLYKYDPTRGAYVGRTPGAEEGAVTNENRPLLIVLQSENDQATGKFFPIGQSLANTVNLHYHWDTGSSAWQQRTKSIGGRVPDPHARQR